MPATIRLTRGVSRYFVGDWGDFTGFFERAFYEPREPRRRVPAAVATTPLPTIAKPPTALPITTSRELPGSTHWDPAPVPVGNARRRNGGGEPGVYQPGIILPVLGVPGRRADVLNEGQPPIIYSPPPILLPGQTDPGREEQESEEGEVAHTWTHLGSQVISGIFGGQPAYDVGPGSGFNLGGGGGTVGGGGGTPAVIAAPAGVNGMEYETGSCARKTRTLTIDCATGLEVKRKRRRRRALLTQGDMGVLFQIASLPNNANVRVALAGAIRR